MTAAPAATPFMSPGERTLRRWLAGAALVLSLFGFLIVPVFSGLYADQADNVVGAGRDFGVQMILFGLVTGTRADNTKALIGALGPIVLALILALSALFAVQFGWTIEWYTWANYALTVIIALVVMFRSRNVFTTP